MGGVKIIEWNESNTDFTEIDFMRQAFERKAWAFVSDYVRLKALYEYGGIYVDADLEVKKTFPNEWFDADLVISWEYDCVVSTAFIMACPRHPFIKALLEMYRSKGLDQKEPNNAVFNACLLKMFPDFRINGRYREFADKCYIFPKRYFTCPTLRRDGGYSVHHLMGSWHSSSHTAIKRLRPLVKWVRFHCFVFDYLYQQRMRRNMFLHSGYRKKYIEDCKLTENE